MQPALFLWFLRVRGLCSAHFLYSSGALLAIFAGWICCGLGWFPFLPSNCHDMQGLAKTEHDSASYGDKHDRKLGSILCLYCVLSRQDGQCREVVAPQSSHRLCARRILNRPAYRQCNLTKPTTTSYILPDILVI